MSGAKQPLAAFWNRNQRRVSTRLGIRPMLVGASAWAGLVVGLLAPFPYGITIGRAVAVMLLTAVSVGAITSHFRQRQISPEDMKRSLRVIFATSVLVIVGMQIARYALAHRGDDPGLALLTAAPLVAGGLLMGALSSPSSAVVALALIGACSWAAGVVTPAHMLAAWLAGAVGAYSVNPLKRRSDLWRSGGLVTAAFACVGGATEAVVQPVSLEVLQVAGWGAIGGVCAVALFWLCDAVFERLFDMASDWGLLELCSPDQPLLHELTLQAPGTWAHSVMVGNLAEAAAKAIGADAVLARACAYYHDIGKMRRPEFFIENQGGTNVHGTISPNLSARVIAAHVKDGIELAEAERLPQVIRDAIGQHHGTSLISFFYQQALGENGQEDPVLKEHFRYEGPKPQRVEVGILMLADVVEAATRALGKVSPARLENAITLLIQERIQDGQLDECELTFKDIRKIINSFVQTLTAVRHQRIDYGEVTDESQGSGDEQVELPPAVAFD